LADPYSFYWPLLIFDLHAKTVIRTDKSRAPPCGGSVRIGSRVKMKGTKECSTLFLSHWFHGLSRLSFQTFHFHSLFICRPTAIDDQSLFPCPEALAVVAVLTANITYAYVYYEYLLTYLLSLFRSKRQHTKILIKNTHAQESKTT